MNTIGKFYKPEQVDYSSIVPAYQEAFKEEPWNEVSKCVDMRSPQRCAGGMSALALNSWCRSCEASPTWPAYEPAELTARFSVLSETRPTLWYIETQENAVALAAVCWLSDVARLMTEKYNDVPAMGPWLDAKFADTNFVYLDEIFRDKTVRNKGNLTNFGSMIVGFGQYFGSDTVTYRSKQPRLLAKTAEVFGTDADIAIAPAIAPDWRARDFVTIRIGAKT